MSYRKNLRVYMIVWYVREALTFVKCPLAKTILESRHPNSAPQPYLVPIKSVHTRRHWFLFHSVLGEVTYAVGNRASEQTSDPAYPGPPDMAGLDQAYKLPDDTLRTPEAQFVAEVYRCIYHIYWSGQNVQRRKGSVTVVARLLISGLVRFLEVYTYIRSPYT